VSLVVLGLSHHGAPLSLPASVALARPSATALEEPVPAPRPVPVCRDLCGPGALGGWPLCGLPGAGQL